VVHQVEHFAESVPLVGPVLSPVTAMLLDGLCGVLAGAVTLVGVTIGQRMLSLFKRS
jgi:hypothetical protein